MSSLDKKLIALAILIACTGIIRIIVGWDHFWEVVPRIWNGEISYFPRWMFVVLVVFFVVVIVTGFLLIVGLFKTKLGGKVES